MKKILIISPYFPYPPRDGGKVRLYNLIKYLAKKNDVYLLAYIEPDASMDSVDTAKQVCKDVFPVVREEDKRIIRNDIPRSASFFYTQAMIDELSRVMKIVKPDIVQLDFLIMTQYVNHIEGVPVFYTEHDMSVLDFNQSFHDRDMTENLRFAEWGRLVEYERKIVEKFKSVIVLTERDKRLIEDFNPKVKAVIIPTGVDVDFYKPVEPLQDEQNLVFVGHYRHYPNADAIIYFVNEIYGKVLKALPDIKLYIVGSGLTKEVSALAGKNKNIVITGEVEDIRQYLKKPNIFIAPIRLGGGIKGKVLEAMAAGVPVIATNEAVDGIDHNMSEAILSGDDADVFALNIIKLVKNKALYNTISKNARIIAEQYYDWKKISQALNDFYSDKIKKL